jgi:hypothetical protein
VPAEKIEDWIVDEMGQRLLDGRAGVYASYEDFERAIWEAVGSQASGEDPDESRRKTLEAALADKRKKIELILTGLAADNLDVANEMIRTLKREIATLEGELATLKAQAPPPAKLDPKAVAREAATYLWHLKEVIEQGTMEERRKIVAYFVEGARINGVEGWVEASFYENPKLAASPVSFCMVPPTGSVPKGNTLRSGRGAAIVPASAALHQPCEALQRLVIAAVHVGVEADAHLALLALHHDVGDEVAHKPLLLVG